MTLSELFNHDDFINRHIGIDDQDATAMLATLGLQTRAQLVDQTVPAGIRFNQKLALPDAISEAEALAKLKTIAGKNKVNKSFIGLGYYPTRLPNVILRNVLENPGWYTAYTPYQPKSPRADWKHCSTTSKWSST